MDRAFVIASFGNRQIQVQRLIKNIRQYSDLPIHILTTHDSNLGFPKNTYTHKIYTEFVDRIWQKGSLRADIRNSNYYKVKFALDHHYHSLCMLDDDMLIVNNQFADGFAIAERFGCALPLNPRIYVSYNMMGADVQYKDIDETLKTPIFASACNFSPFFVYPHCNHTRNFLSQLEKELRENVCRGTLAIWKASWKSQITPVYLPEQWCVCGENAEYIKNYSVLLQGKLTPVKPIMLHLGHEKVKEVFGID
jgi:hypothetical protein